MPTSPQQAAGMRIDPIPSLPCATGTMPAATLAALPPDEPPGVRARSHGLWVTPNTESVAPKTHSSGTRVSPTTTAPAARSRRTTSWSDVCGVGSVAAEPMRIGSPATGTLSLTAMGTPASGSVRAVGIGVDAHRLRQSPLGADHLERADGGVAVGDAVQRRLDRGDRREVTTADGVSGLCSRSASRLGRYPATCLGVSPAGSLRFRLTTATVMLSSLPRN